MCILVVAIWPPDFRFSFANY